MPKISLSCLLCVASLLLFHCKASHRDNPVQKTDLHSVVEPYLGKTYQTDYNNSKTFVLCQQTRQQDHMNRKFNYSIVRLADMKIIHQDFFQNGYARWINDQEVEVLTTPQGSKSDSSHKKVIAVNSSQQ